MGTKLNISNKTWLISDTHFGHNNIIQYGARPRDHELIILYHWTRLVGETDQILHLGDVFFKNRDRWKVLISKLPGQKFLLRGNHDKESMQFYADCGFQEIPPFVEKGYSFTHRPHTIKYPGASGDWHTNIHGHIHNNGWQEKHEGELYADRHYINLSCEMTDLMPVQFGQLQRKDAKWHYRGSITS